VDGDEHLHGGVHSQPPNIVDEEVKETHQKNPKTPKHICKDAAHLPVRPYHLKIIFNLF
jgi:hypothetical protein